MAGYWVSTDLAQYVVQPVLGSLLITPTSFPVNASQFQEFINGNSGLFDSAAAKAGYVTPIPSSASAAFEIARTIVRNGAVADALRTVYTTDPRIADKYQTMFDTALEAIEQGNRPLPGAPIDPSAEGRLLPIYAGIASPVMNATIGYPNDLGVPRDF